MAYLVWLIALSVVILPVQAQEVLRFKAWKDYIDPAVLENFQQETGIRVDYQTFTTAEELDQALVRGEHIDVLVPSHFQLAGLIANKRLQALDFRQLPHYASVDPELLAMLAALNSANRYVVPYLWGTVGLAVNPRLAEPAFGRALPNSWSLLFDERDSASLEGCGIGWLDAPEETLSLWLNYRGKNLGRSSEGQISRAGRSLLELGRRTRSLDNERYIEDLSSGRLCVAMAWVGHALTAAKANPSLQFLIPQEGALVFIDSLAIPANAPHPELAYRFIDYLLQPENSVRNSLATQFYSPLSSGAPELVKLAKEQPMLVPDQRERRRLYFLEKLSVEQKQAVDRLWQGVKQSRTAVP
ncbi:extracellular solute-binding protein [Pseudomonas cavernae]|uniref:Extracellular solute-binding protein n=1 Tax=Pseudomonas cavernae TaxID=2320867 RepID=A0A385Z3P5_9PSED|nr:extracellular solute-binding protein [Pseudomonas cavernae]AYC32378.1 extracellular solute-binding protein [Pseudomonas cavernae]